MQSLSARWAALSARTRQWVLLGASVVLTTAVLSAVLLRGQAPAYQPLFMNLSGTQVARVEQELALRGVPFRMAGGTVTVPGGEVARERMALAAVGLPGAAQGGLSSLTHLPFTATPTQQQAAMLAAMQGEMARAIETLQGVGSAHVRLALAVPSPYAGQTSPATGSVTLRLLPGTRLTRAQVRAIQNVVASGVPGLATHRVAVVDQYGDLLSAGVGVASAGAGLPRALRAQQAYDKALRGQLDSMLAQVFGAGNALARVSVTLNMSASHSDATKYGPAAGAIPSSTSTGKVTWKGAAPAIGGVAGATTNTPTYGVPVGVAGAKGSGTAVQARTRYSVSRSVLRTSTPPGQVTGMTVAVAVNGALSAAQTAQVRSLVLSATGFTGAKVTVVGLPFRVPLKKAAATKAKIPWRLLGAVAASAGALVALVVVLGMRRKRKATAPVAAQAEPPSESVRDQQLRTVREAANEDVAAVVQAWLAETEAVNGRG